MRLFRIFLLFLCMMPFLGCHMLISDAQEVEIGRRYQQEIARDTTLVRDPEAIAFLTRLGDRLVSHAPSRLIPYTFHLIQSDTPNAFAIPGAHIYFHTGIVNLAENEAEFASVVAHEIAHVAALHHKTTMGRALTIEIVNDLAFGKNANETGQLLTELAEKGVMLQFGRQQEYQADEIGCDILYRSGYDPKAMISMFERLQKKQGKEPGKIFEVFSSHPLTRERIDHISTFIREKGMNRALGRWSSPEYNDFRSRF